MSTPIKPRLILDTVRYMTPRQWFFRLFYAAEDLLCPHPRVNPIPVSQVSPLRVTPCPAVDTAVADGILNNHFPTVNGFTEVFPGEIDWDLTGCTYRLRCFRLNAFSFLESLSDAFTATGDARYLEKGFSLMEDWQQRCGSRKCGDKWNAYVIAQRLRNQILFLSAHGDTHQHQHFAPLLAAQAYVLSRHMEYQLGGNHLLSEGCALLYAGAYLRDGILYSRGRETLEREFDVQFLPDGGHYERSVSYHCESLQQYFEALWLMLQLGDRDAAYWIQRLQRPCAFLNAMLMNGSIPLVNDAALDYPFDAADLLFALGQLYTPAPPHGKPGAYSRHFPLSVAQTPISWAVPPLLRATGFLCCQEGFHGLFLDAGDNGPDCNPGHAHADALSFLWTAEGNPMFIDTGVYTYAPGAERDACRATAAHNTVEIDGTNSSEVWGAFRTARRGHTAIEDYRNNSFELSLTASHDGYRHMLPDPVTHRRRLHVDKPTGVITITDTLIPKAQSHSATLRFHLAPTCSAVVLDSHTISLDGRYLLQCSHPVRLEACQAAQRFGVKEASRRIVSQFSIQGTTTVTTVIRRENG